MDLFSSSQCSYQSPTWIGSRSGSLCRRSSSSVSVKSVSCVVAVWLEVGEWGFLCSSFGEIFWVGMGEALFCGWKRPLDGKRGVFVFAMDM